MTDFRKINVPLDDMPEFLDEDDFVIEVEDSPLQRMETQVIPARQLADILFEELQIAANNKKGK